MCYPRKIGRLFDGVDLLVDVSHAAHAVPAGKNIDTAVAADFGQQLAHRLGERDALVPAALGPFLLLALDGDEATLEVNVRPFEAEEFAAPHAGIIGHEHELPGLAVVCVAGGIDEAGALLGGEHFGFDIVQARHLKMKLCGRLPGA